ncbi:hypothetical protein MTAT_26690 [Moorella thermoacetica]|uniref:HNH endonuclease n=1 Tax=Neomoorella thermoacetica TaxID=1525 RepID=A0AAC9HFG4_NEOTH|nr:RNA-guided endonuclease IscB [Moorella thermoacetica]AOQ23031.1 HNH endonuclease [Moorella thermoacetica]TYL09002.1 hypothetical protein MTAT_26690 [Moorella thermoacetica]
MLACKQKVYVYVLNKHGKPLMPCSPKKARVLLKEGKAKVVRVVPFTIQLLYGSSGYKQKIYAGRDRGLTQGIAAVRKDGETLFLGEVTGRRDISELMYERSSLRRSRRSRKTPYRPCRIDNRKRKEGWLPPSVNHLWYEHQKTRSLVESILPVTEWAEEINKFDTHKMVNPEVKGKGYQEGPLKGKKNYREYVLERDSYRCVLCGEPEGLEVHHIVWRFRGGSDRPKNLVTLCKDCHDKVTKGEIEIKKVIESYRWPARLNALNPQFNALEGVKVPAYKVKEARLELGLDKAHYCDALALIHAAFGIIPRVTLPKVIKGRFVRSKNRQLHRANPIKGGVRPKANANRYLVNKNGVRFQKYDLVSYRTKKGEAITGYVNTLFSRGTVRIADFFGKELYNGASVNRLRKWQNNDTLIWEVA